MLIFCPWEDLNGIRPNVVCYSALARPFAHNGDWRFVEDLAKQMTSQGLRMNEYFLYALLLAYAKGQPREESRAEHAVRKAYAEGVDINQHIVTVLVRAVGRMHSRQILRDLRIPFDYTKPFKRQLSN